MYNPYEFIDVEEEKDYMCNAGAIVCETVAQGDYIIAGNIALGLPSLSDVIKKIKEGRVACLPNSQQILN